MSSRVIVIIAVGIVILGAVFLVAGIVIGFSGVMDGVVNERIKENVQLKEGTEQFERWEELPFPLLFKVYVFNVTNPDEIIAGEKPIVEEIGPWVYKQYRTKRNISYEERNDTLTYKQYLHFEFDREQSAFDEDFDITVLNMPLQGLFFGAEDNSMLGSANSFWTRAFVEGEYFLTLPANKYFFDGYEFCFADGLNLGARVLCTQIRRSESKTLTSDSEKIKFALFAHKQDANDGEYEISAGNNDVNTLGEILSWEGEEYLSTWNGEDSTCNHIRGRDSSIYPPFNNESSSFDIFNTDICRVANLQTIRTAVYAGIDGIMATMNVDEMKNTGDKDCYCIQVTQDLNGGYTCLPDGFADMGTCLGSPAIASFPHMLGAAVGHISAVEGLEPDEDKHKSFVILEPDTGTPLQGAKRMQFNMIIRPFEQIEVTANLQRVIFPVVWVEESFNLPDDLIQKLKSQLSLLPTVTWSLIGVGIGLIVISGGYLVFRWIRK